MARKKAEDEHRYSLQLILCFALCCAANAQKGGYIVVFDDANQQMATMDVQGMDVSTQNDVMLESVLGVASTYRKYYDYSRCMRGVAVAMSPEQAEIARRNPAIKSVIVDETVHTATTHSPDYMAMQNSWNRSGGVENAGEDMVIGIVDTGIYPDHPSFAATDGVKPFAPLASFQGTCGTDSRMPKGFCNGKIVGATQFFHGALLDTTVNASDPDYYSPLDGNGHGTHCAGTAAGNQGVSVVVNGADYGKASGTAPRARLAIYKALNEQGSGQTSDIVAAIDQAIKDGVHVLSLSLGGPTNAGLVTFTLALELAFLGAAKAGLFVVHAAGNLGSQISTVVSYGPWVTSVGASSMDRSYPNYFYTADGKKFFGQGLAPGTPGATDYALVSATDAALAGQTLNSDFDCADATMLDKKLIQGKILLCNWDGVMSFTGTPAGLARVAANATGAVGTVLLTPNQYFPTLSPSQWNFQDFPGIVIWGDQYTSFLNYVTAANGAAKGRIAGGTTAVYTGLPPWIAPFSSRGPDLYLSIDDTTVASQTGNPVADVLKPTIVAPGVDIWSAWSPLPSTDNVVFQGEKFCMLSGTSMATPHLAGVAAIVRQKYPTWSPATVASALATTAISLDSLNNPLGSYYNEVDEFGAVTNQVYRVGNAFDFGHGFVDAATALDPGLVFDATYADYIKFLCSVSSLTAADVTAATGQSCPANPGLTTDLNLPSITVGTLQKTLTVPRTVTNVGPSQTFTALVTQPADVDVVVDPDMFTIAANATQMFTVTLKALKGAVYVNQTSFGSIYLTGSLGHRVKVPITVTYRQVLICNEAIQALRNDFQKRKSIRPLP